MSKRSAGSRTPTQRAPSKTSRKPGNQEPASGGRRLAAFLSDAGVASRRKAEVLVREGKVTVNGSTVLDPARAVNPARDRVTAAGEPVRRPTARTYLILNKPRGYLSACGDPGGKPTVLDLIPPGGRLFPVGRLDFNAEGLILLTDDGQIALRMTHPRYQVPRTYLVKVKGQPKAPELALLTRGVRDGGEFLRAREVRAARKTGSNAWFEVVMTEGKNREVRRLFAAIGYLVVRIVRLSFGPLSLGTLPTGQFRLLRPREVRELREYVGGHGG